MRIEMCGKCNGIGEVPSGHTDAWGRSCWMTCPTCDGLRAVLIETADEDPEPSPPAPAGRLVVGTYAVDAPTFRDATRFDQAIRRAFMDGLELRPTERGDTVAVVNPTTGRTYLTTRRSCTCPARAGCKHQAAAIIAADVWHSLPRPIATPVAA